jgi:hypothetical protein
MLLMMKDISENATLTIHQKKSLEQGLDFFMKALRGKEIVDTLKLSGDCIEATKMYGVALSVLRKLRTENHIQSDDSGSILARYVTSFKILVDSPKIEKNDLNRLQELRTFFKALREVAWQKTERPTEQVKILGRV